MTTAVLPIGLRVRTRAVRPPAGGLVGLLPDARDPLCWVRGGEGLVGWGEIARFTVSGPERFTDADAWWADVVAGLDVQDEVGLPGTGAVAFAAFTFSARSAGSTVVVPRVVVGQRDGRAWITEITDGREPAPDLRRGRRDTPTGWLRAVTPVRPAARLRYREGAMPVARYRAAVAEAVRRMRAGELGKAALAHDLVAVAEAPLDPRHLLAELADRHPTCWAFAVDGLVGATPELLLRRQGDRVDSRVLAGTIWPESGTGAQLLASAKDREEHAFAVESLAERLRPFCRTLDVPAEPSLLPLRNVSHLASDVTGTVRSGSLLEIAQAVHPTAAVGGTPREASVALIEELEGMDRGRYAGPVGWLGSDGGGELGLALRCAQLDGPVARLFAGCGIVAGSDPDTEVREAAAKLAAVREALEAG